MDDTNTPATVPTIGADETLLEAFIKVREHLRAQLRQDISPGTTPVSIIGTHTNTHSHFSNHHSYNVDPGHSS